ncbi:MAG TPA: hypothetical protein VJ813_00680 [Vicinamibacterales bacterium]|nr:hypothetical protein [Vicinamibacterales bacterium]
MTAAIAGVLAGGANVLPAAAQAPPPPSEAEPLNSALRLRRRAPASLMRRRGFTLIGNTMHTRSVLLCATAVLACSTVAACGGDDGNAGPTGGALATAPSPTPTLPPQYTATPVPFNLTQNRTFDILGWDSWPSAPTPSAIQFRWNAAIAEYEVLAPGYADWSRLEALQDLRFGGTPHNYDVFGSGGAKLPFYMIVSAPPHRPPADGYVGNARIFESSFARAYFAFGIATEPGDVPVSGTMTCSFGEDEIGGGGLTFDLAAGTVSGWVEPFWADVRYDLVQRSFAPVATSFAATFGTDGVLEGRFFGGRAFNVAVRAKGGGQGSAAVSGIMTGVCEG